MAERGITVSLEAMRLWGAGQFTNDSEYLRDLIRRDQASQADVEAIRAGLIEGEESGEPQLFDSSQFKQEMSAKHGDKIR